MKWKPLNQFIIGLLGEINVQFRPDLSTRCGEVELSKVCHTRHSLGHLWDDVLQVYEPTNSVKALKEGG